MKRILNTNSARVMLFVFTLSMLFSGVALAQTAWYDDNPAATEFYIGNGAELAYLATLVTSATDNFLGKTITLTADIDIAGLGDENGWIPIGTSVLSRRFNGTFDGNGYVVKNLYINRPTKTYQGLFGYLRLGSSVKNLGVINVDVTGDNYTGGLAGYSVGTIENCFTTGSVVGFDDDIHTAGHYVGEYIGGIAGTNGEFIRNSYSTADVTGRTITGGIGGGFSGTAQYRTTSEYLYSTGKVISTYSHQNTSTGGTVGGIFGWVQYQENTIQNAVALNEALVSGNERGAPHKRIAYEDVTHASTIDFINNYAWEGMTFNGTIIPGGTTDSEDGQSVSADQIYNGTVWGAGYANFPTDTWLIQPGKLPILKIFETRNSERGGVSVQTGAVPVHVMTQVTEPIITDPVLTGIGVKYDDGAVAVKNAERLAVATLWIKADSGTPSFVGMNNFVVLDSAKEGSLYRVTLGYLVAGGQGFTSANAGLLTISGASGVEIIRAKFVSYDDNGNAVNVSYNLDKETGGGVVLPPVDPPVEPATNYDLNGDGAVDQLDLAIALSFYMVNGGEANWNSAKKADFNKDGVVDIEDFIRLLNNMTF